MPMHIQITFHGVSHSSAIHQYLEEKLHKITKHTPSIESANCVFSLDKTDQVAAITLYGHRVKFFADGVTKDMYASIDRVIKKLERQLTKFKEQVKNHKCEPKINEADFT